MPSAPDDQEIGFRLLGKLVQAAVYGASSCDS
jgi:hypothetical protein